MSLIDTFFSVGLYLPLSTLSFRILIDALSFSKFVQRQVHRIRTVQQLQHEICIEQFSQRLQEREDTGHYSHLNLDGFGEVTRELSYNPKNNNIYVIQKRRERLKDNAKVVLLCTKILNMKQGRTLSVFRYIQLQMQDSPNLPITLLH